MVQLGTGRTGAPYRPAPFLPCLSHQNQKAQGRRQDYEDDDEGGKVSYAAIEGDVHVLHGFYCRPYGAPELVGSASPEGAVEKPGTNFGGRSTRSLRGRKNRART